MFLFKASSADYPHWCPPPPFQRLAPRGGGGEAFPLNRTAALSRELLPLVRSSLFPSSISSSSLSSLLLGSYPVLSWITLGVRCSPSRRLLPVTSFCFDSSPMLFGPSLWAEGRIGYVARRSGLCGQVVSWLSDWSGRCGGREGWAGLWRPAGQTAEQAVAGSGGCGGLRRAGG